MSNLANYINLYFKLGHFYAFLIIFPTSNVLFKNNFNISNNILWFEKPNSNINIIPNNRIIK